MLAVAAGEGGIRYGAVGDGGTSFGPFQLHWQGAMPRKYWGNSAASAAFANSPAGINYALQQMVKAGAGGLQGEAAVNAIVRKFERPADPDSSVANAIARLPQFKGSGVAAKGGKVGAPQAEQAFATSPAGVNFFKQQAGAFFMQQAQAAAAGEPVDFNGILALSQMKQQALVETPVEEPAPSFGRAPASPTKVGKGGVAELFYDPLGAYDEGKWIKPIGGHGNHVHVSFRDPQTAVAAIRLAQQLGLRAAENPYVDRVDPVHTKTSYHYRTFGQKVGGRPVGQALDVSGNSAAMAKFFNTVRSRYL